MSHSARSAWIETVIYPSGEVEMISRTPQGVRGLKHESPARPGSSHRVALRKECVD